MSLSKLRIVVDDRERKSRIPNLLKAIGITVTMKTLSVGDYVVAPEVVIERKSIRDLIASVFDGRLFDQCNRLKKYYKHPVLLVEGDVIEIEDMTENPLIFYGALSSVILEYNIPVLHTPTAEHTVKLLVAMCSRKENSKGPLIKKIKKSNNIQQQQLSVLSSLPGVGEKIAIRMLEKMHTPLNVLNATSVDLGKIQGLGTARAKKIHSMLHKQNKHEIINDQSKLD